MKPTGGVVYIPAGYYNIDSPGIQVDSSLWNDPAGHGHLIVRGDGRATVLHAIAPNITVLRWSDSYGQLEDLTIDGGGQSAVVGLGLVGKNVGGAEYIGQNTISRVEIQNCDEGIVLQCPNTGGCYYNQFEHCTLHYNHRHIYLKDNAITKGPNRNNFIGVTMSRGTVGIYIDGADTTCLVGCAFEDLIDTSSKAAAPTAVITTDVGSASGAFTADTSMIGCMFENCTYDLYCRNRRMTIVGGTCAPTDSKIYSGSVTPDLWLGGDHLYQMRQAQFGGATDGLLVQPRQIAYKSGPQVSTSSNQSAAYPFNGDGHLFLQGRDSSAHDILFVTGSPPTPRVRVTGAGHLLPGSDGGNDLGSGTSRWRNIYATNGTITTSDAREKLVRGGLNAAELRAARRIASMAIVFQWHDAIAEKGEAARLHCGVAAQAVRDAFHAEGLDPDRYAMNCKDEITDQSGEPGTRYSLRYSELTSFVMAAQEQRLAALEGNA